MQDYSQLTEEQKQESIKQLESYVEITRKSKDYSIQRFDILAITICGAGIYTDFELMKFIASSTILNREQISSFNLPFKVSALFFTLSIISNFISQWTAYRCLYWTIEYTKLTVLIMRGLVSESYSKAELMKKRADFYNRWSNPLNIATISFLGIGVLLIILFGWVIF